MTKDVYTLGRAKTCDLEMNENTLKKDKQRSVISKEHFRIVREILGWALEESVVYLEDLSHNGTFVNRVLVGRGKRIILENNSTIALAQSGFKGRTNNEFPFLPDAVFIVNILRSIRFHPYR